MRGPASSPILLLLSAREPCRPCPEPIPYSQRIWFYVLAPVVVPGYILGTRGWRGLGYVVFHCLAWFALMISVMMLASLVYYGAA